MTLTLKTTSLESWRKFKANFEALEIKIKLTAHHDDTGYTFETDKPEDVIRISAVMGWEILEG